jgi:aconitate hydratase 2/2-methylisocitrate dehydratase
MTIGKVEFKAPLVVAPPTYIVDELEWEVLQKYSGFEFDDNVQKV